ncbi:hypothetical protein ACLMJK_004892 [Lecanora helva]
MASERHGETNGTRNREQYVTEAVTNKRKILDEEIVAFTAVKDQEFRAFEACLRRMPGQPTVADAEAHVQSLGLRYKIKKPKLLKGVNHPDHPVKPKPRSDESIVYYGHAGYIGEETLGPEEEAARIRLMAKKRAEKRGEVHEREREFEGVITPSYLPLLGGDVGGPGKENERLPSPELPLSWRKNSQGNETMEGTGTRIFKNIRERQEMKLEIAEARRAATPVLSSSAENRPPPLTSPPANTSRPISSSVPQDQKHGLDHRRSSSRSDVSIDGLRSSLKDPSQPKSPKRVQFSIDDTVVSPSTSPLARRPSAEANQAVGKKEAEKFEVVKGKREGKSSVNGLSNDGTSSTSSSQTLNGSMGSISSLGSYFHSPRNANTPFSSSTNGAASEDYQILDADAGDDVFSFEEHTPSESSSSTKKGYYEEDMTEDDDIEETMRTEPTLTGSSPHAGSLPIEIHMPERRGWGGGGVDNEG